MNNSSATVSVDSSTGVGVVQGLKYNSSSDSLSGSSVRTRILSVNFMEFVSCDVGFCCPDTSPSCGKMAEIWLDDLGLQSVGVLDTGGSVVGKLLRKVESSCSLEE